MMDKSIAILHEISTLNTNIPTNKIYNCVLFTNWETNEKESFVVKLSQMFAYFLCINHSPEEDGSNYKLHQTSLLIAPFENEIFCTL